MHDIEFREPLRLCFFSRSENIQHTRTYVRIVYLLLWLVDIYFLSPTESTKINTRGCNLFELIK